MASAAKHLIAGDLVAFPTETVYGLGADASNMAAVARIYSVKGRPNDHPLIVHIASMDRMGDWASNVPEYAIALAREFWPGPMTLVLKRSELAGDFVTGGQDTVGVRVPDHVVALALLEAFEKAGGKGIAAPSANRFGNVSPTTADAVVEELAEYLSQDDLVLDGGACAVGVESTIIDCTAGAPKILRPGAVSIEMIIRTTQLKMSESVNAPGIRVSGSLESHYSPAAMVILDEPPIPGQGFIAMAAVSADKNVVRLAAPKTTKEFAQVMYSALREADRQGLETVVIHQPSGQGISIAIRDRLKRAAYKL